MRSILQLLVFAGTAVLAQSSNLSLTVNAAGFSNYVIRDNTTDAVVLLPYANASAPVQRLVVAQAAENSGFLTFFLSSPNATNTSITASLVNGSLQTITGSNNQAGVSFEVELSANASIGTTIIGAVRAMRDYTEGAGTMHEIFNYTVANLTQDEIFLHRQFINSSTSYDVIFRPSNNARFEVAPSNNGTYTPPTMNIVQLDASSPATISIQALSNITQLEGLGPEGIFQAAGSSTTNTSSSLLTGLEDGSNPAANQVSFISYTDKFLAGSWRFLTYFGRDTMLTAILTLPIMKPSATDTIMTAVLDRINSTGALCHEETIGDYASFINIQNGNYDLGATPYYDYKMIDTDLELVPLMHALYEANGQNATVLSNFLDQTSPLANDTYRNLLIRNIEYNMGRAAPFAQNPVYSNLLGARIDPSTGSYFPVSDWRDSNPGLGYGLYPFDVNTALVPANLYGIAALSQAGIINSSYASNASAMATVWQEATLPLFQVNISATDMQSRLSNFVTAANLSTALLSNSSSSNDTSSFYALSLNEDGSQVEVLNSDLSFNIFYLNNVSASVIQATVNALQTYPTGLLSGVGMVVANPAYDSNTTNIQVFDNTAYHGTVIWSFQQAMMAQGVAKQLASCDSSTAASWCSTSLKSDLQAAQTRLWNSINSAAAEKFTEVWTYSFDNSTNQFSVVDLGAVSGTEADAIQLWSYAFLATPDPTASSL